MRFGQTAMFTTFLVTIGLILLLVVGIYQGKDSAWWAAWGQWVGGVGSIAAAVTALWIAFEGWKKADRQAEGFRQREERELASQFGVWIEKSEVTESFGKTREMYFVKVRNSTAQPMYGVSVGVEFGQGTLRFFWRQPIVGPSDVPVNFEAERGAFHERLMRAVVKLRESRVGDSHGEMANALADTNSDLDYWHVINTAKMTVEFTDGNNVQWCRDIPGKLTKG